MKKLLLLTLGLFLTACGGGDNETVQTNPKAEAPKPTQITITVEQTTDGQSPKSQSKVLNEGERFKYTFSDIEGHVLSLKESSCEGELEGNDYIIKEVKQNCSVKVLYNPKAISINLATDENSTIELTKASYFYGEKVELTVAATDGYMIEKVSGCGVKKQQDKSYIIEKLKSDCKISTSTLPTQKQFAASQLPNIEVAILSEDTAILDSSQGLLAVDDEQLIPVPEKLSFEHGILALDLKVPEGKSAKVQLTYETQLPAEFTYQKLIGEQWQALDKELVKVSDDRFSLELSLTDGGAGDADGVVNGVIKDPGAPASLKYYQVSASSNAGGTVSPNTQLIAHGTKGLLEITPLVGFELAKISGCEGELTGLTYTTAAITSNCAVTVSFQPKSLLITASSGEGGSITPEQQNITYGTQAKFTVTADEGQTLQAIQGCNGSLNGNVYTTGVITEQCSISASFEPQILLVTTQVSEGGSIAPLSKQLAYSEQTSFTLTPSEGYSLAAVTGCEGVLAGNVFTTGAVTANCQVQASFELNTYTVTATASEGGSATPATQNVNHGSNAQITLTANEGYSLSSVTGCNGTLNGNVFTTGAVTANCQVQASFELNTYTVTATASEGGSATPSSQNVNHGSNVQIILTANEGYSLSSVTGCNGTLNGNVYTTGAVTANCQIQANFEDIRPEYSVTINVGVGGSVASDVLKVRENEQISFDILTEIGYVLFSAHGCDGQLDGNTYTTGPITNDCTATVQFKEQANVATHTRIISLSAATPHQIELVWLLEGTALTEQDIVNASHKIYLSEQPIDDISQLTPYAEVTGVLSTNLNELDAATTYFVRLATTVEAETLLSEQHSITTPQSAVVETGTEHLSQVDSNLKPLAITENTITYQSQPNSTVPAQGSIIYNNDLEDLAEFNYIRKVKSVQTNNNVVEVSTEPANISDIVQSGEFNTSFTLFEPINYASANNTNAQQGVIANPGIDKAQQQYKSDLTVVGSSLEKRTLMKQAGLMVVEYANKEDSPKIKQFIEQAEQIQAIQQPKPFKDRILNAIVQDTDTLQSSASNITQSGVRVTDLPKQLSGNVGDSFSFYAKILLVEPQNYQLKALTWSLTNSEVDDEQDNFGAEISYDSSSATKWPITFQWQPEEIHGVNKGEAFELAINIKVTELDCSFLCEKSINLVVPIQINEVSEEIDEGISLQLPTNRVGKVGQRVELDFQASIAKQSDIDDDIVITDYEIVSFQFNGQDYPIPEFSDGFSEQSVKINDVVTWQPSSAQFEAFSQYYEKEQEILPFKLTVAATAEDIDCASWRDLCQKGRAELTIDLFIQKDISLGTGAQTVILYENDKPTDNGEVSARVGFTYELDFEPRLDIGVELKNAEIDNARLMLGGKLDFDLETFATLEGQFSKTYKTGDTTERDDDGNPVYDRESLYKKTYYKLYMLGYVPVVQQIDFVIDAEATFNAAASLELNKDFEFSKFIEMGLVYENGQWKRVQNDGTTQSMEFTAKVAANAELNVKLIPKLSTTFYKVATAGLALEPSLNAAVGVEGIFQLDENSGDAFYNYRLHQATAKYHIALTGWADLTVWSNTLVKYPADEPRALIWEYPATGDEEQERNATLFSVPSVELGIDSYQGSTITLGAITEPGRNAFNDSNGSNEFIPHVEPWQVFTLSNAAQGNKAFTLLEKEAGIASFTGELGNVYTIYYVGNDSAIGPLARNYSSVEIDYTDNDADGMPHYWEELYCINGASPDYRAEADIDNDGLTNLEEFNAGSMPHTCDGSNASQDSDGDGMPDGWEVKYGLNPLDNDADLDADGDGVSNLDEYHAGTVPSPVRGQVKSIAIFGQSNLEHGKNQQFIAQATYSDESTEQVAALWQLAEEYEGVTLSAQGVLSTSSAELTRTITLYAEFLGVRNSFDVLLMPTPINTPPLANAGSDQTVNAGVTVTLDATQSSDVEDDSAQIPLTYYWEQVDTTGHTVALSGNNDVTPSFIAPEVTNEELLKFKLTVIDSGQATAEDFVEVTISPVINEIITFKGLKYGVVKSPKTSLNWLDRNLGAKQVCTSSTDIECYGDYFQWGRKGNGHEKYDSEIIKQLIDEDTTANNKFILVENAPWDWRTSRKDDLWVGHEALNNPCPPGFRVPTIRELEAEIVERYIFEDDFLRLPFAGGRGRYGLFEQGVRFRIWSSDSGGVGDGGLNGLAISMWEGVVRAKIYRSLGQSVRCIESEKSPSTPSVTGKLNDTGIIWCANGNTNNLDCPVEGYEGQDAEHGRDAQAKAGTLQKVGGGNGGFDFTKLDANGNDLPQSASAWSCVRDNHTGLIWEVKTDDGGLHDRDDRYNWYNPDSNSNRGHPGYEDDDGDICYGYDVSNSASYCNTHAYMARVNSQSLCGANDWRLPNREELRSIVDYGVTDPAIDTGYFPQTQSARYWASSPYANYTSSAWSVFFDSGQGSANDKRNGGPVRLVRGGQ